MLTASRTPRPASRIAGRPNRRHRTPPRRCGAHRPTRTASDSASAPPHAAPSARHRHRIAVAPGHSSHDRPAPGGGCAPRSTIRTWWAAAVPLPRAATTSASPTAGAHPPAGQGDTEEVGWMKHRQDDTPRPHGGPDSHVAVDGDHPQPRQMSAEPGRRPGGASAAAAHRSRRRSRGRPCRPGPRRAPPFGCRRAVADPDAQRPRPRDGRRALTPSRASGQRPQRRRVGMRAVQVVEAFFGGFGLRGVQASR